MFTCSAELQQKKQATQNYPKNSDVLKSEGSIRCTMSALMLVSKTDSKSLRSIFNVKWRTISYEISAAPGPRVLPQQLYRFVLSLSLLTACQPPWNVRIWPLLSIIMQLCVSWISPPRVHCSSQSFMLCLVIWIWLSSPSRVLCVIIVSKSKSD